MKSLPIIFILLFSLFFYTSCEKVNYGDIEPTKAKWHQESSDGKMTIMVIDDQGNSWYYEGEEPVKLKKVKDGTVPSVALEDISGIMWDLHFGTGTDYENSNYFHIDMGGMSNSSGNYGIPYYEGFREDDYNDLKAVFREHCLN